VRERRPSHSSGCCSVAAPHPLRNASRETAHLVVEAYLALMIGPEQRSARSASRNHSVSGWRVSSSTACLSVKTSPYSVSNI
jgi:hypothetical protein